MKQMLKRSLISLVMAGLLLPAMAQADSTTTEGTLMALSGTTAPATMTIQSGVTTYTVNVAADTKLVRKYNGESSLEEFAVGDMVAVKGEVTGTTIVATRIRNLTIQRRGGLFNGTIVSLNATDKTFVLDPTDHAYRRLANQTVTTTAASKFYIGEKAAAFSDLAVGMKVKVIGLWRKTQNTVVADRTMIRLSSLSGTVASVTCGTDPKTMTVSVSTKVTSSTKKSSIGLRALNDTKTVTVTKIWAVSLRSDAVIRDSRLNTVSCDDITVGDTVHIRGIKTGATAMSAVQVRDKNLKRRTSTWQGTIKSIDSTAKSFVLNRKEGIDPNVTTSAGTIYVNKAGTVISFTSLAVDHKVLVFGTSIGATLNANLIVDLSLP